MAASALRAFARYPSLLVALGLVWVGLAAAGWIALPHVLDLFDSPALDSQTTFWLAVAALGVCVFAVTGLALSFGCLMVLERVRQIEMDEPRSLTGALGSALAKTVRALPLVLIWSVLWLAVNAVGILLGGDEDDDRDAGDSLLGWSLRAACDAMRMLLFCSLPALAWEVGVGPVAAVKRGMAVARRHKVEFGVGLLLSELAAQIAFLPLVAAAVAYARGVDLPEVALLGVVALSLLLWTLVMLVQQLYAAELYVWHLLWEDASARSVAAGDAPLAADAVARPSLLDGVPALAAVG
jgi:hypothetical protein